VPVYAYWILATGWIAWFLPFPLNGWNFKPAAHRDKRSRWGILLQAISYSLLWQGPFWLRPLTWWRTALATLFFLAAAIFSWTAVKALGKHLRFDAAIGVDHQLVQSGAYRWLRHPIYTSMFCLLLATGLLFTPALLLLIAVVVFIAGTEIRVRIEDGLLLSHFGEPARDYQRSVSAYIPFLR
jgi:protein-S-isoprenylcysteine O-methyltransferase Ste14